MHTRILYVSSNSPFKADYGAELRSLHIRRALELMGKVEVAIVKGENGESAESAAYPEVVHTFDLQEFPHDRLSKKVRWFLDPRMPYPHGRGVRVKSESVIGQVLQRYHLIWFSKLRTANLFRTWSWPRSVVDVDDIPSSYERSVLQNGGSAVRKFSAALRLFSWKRRERLLGDRFNVMAVCSVADQKYLRSLAVGAPIHVIPNGSEKSPQLPVRNPADPPRIGFVGLIDYYPNREGIRWFLDRCWPAIKERIPNARLRIAGKGSDGPLVPDVRDVDRLGWVTALGDEIATWTVMIVPIRLGAGMRGKIAEGFGRKCPIVSTSLGAFGYEVSNREEVLLADTAEDFSAACVRAILNPVEITAMAERAYRKFLLHWTWEAISPRIWAAAENCLSLTAAATKGTDEH